MRSPKRILIVEDETLTAMALGFHLQEMGYEVLDYSATGEDAVRKAREESPDVIFMDVRLAGAMDGIEAARIINTNRRIPVIIITGYTSRAVVERSSEYQPTGFLIKPIDFDDLNDILAAIS